MLYGPFGARIGGNVSGWHCRRSLTLNNIGGARTHTFFNLAEVLFERSEFLIATSPPQILCVCVCSTNLGFSVGYILCTRYVCTTLYDTRYLVRIMYEIRMIPGTYYVPDTYVPHLPLYYNINSTAVSLLVYSLVGGGTHDTLSLIHI